MARHARTLLLIAAAAATWALSHALAPGLDAGWLSLLPALALVAFLLDGRYLGEARLAAARRGCAPQLRRRSTRTTPPPRRRAASRRRHGGLLLARRLAGRAPPLAA